jgi:hypothetical protein
MKSFAPYPSVMKHTCIHTYTNVHTHALAYTNIYIHICLIAALVHFFHEIICTLSQRNETYMHTYIHKCTHTRTRIHKHIHTYMPHHCLRPFFMKSSAPYPSVHTYIHTYTHKCIHAVKFLCTYTYIHIHTQMQTRSQIHAWTFAHTLT